MAIALVSLPVFVLPTHQKAETSQAPSLARFSFFCCIELDFIINYDIKKLMGDELNAED